MPEKNNDLRQQSGNPFVIVAIAVGVVALLSLVDWSGITGHYLKNFNLLSDILPEQTDSVAGTTGEFIDPDLQQELLSIQDGPEVPVASADSVPTLYETVESSITANSALDTLPVRDVPDQLSLVNDEVVLEDYTVGQVGLANLKRALAQRASRPVRIGMIGDSYIEGDIITMDLRDRMQDAFGGRGVGYVAAHNNVQGFRQTVGHSDSGWTQVGTSKASKSDYFTLAGEYFVGGANSTINLKGIKNNPNLQAWNQSRLMFIAPSFGSIVLTDSDGESHTFEVAASPDVQSVVLPGETTSLRIDSNVPGLVLFGVWLEDNNGVVLDNMSVRGDSGISRRHINTSLAQQLRSFVDYDLIIVEYGINALSATQTDYTHYGNMMVSVIQRLKEAYPNADIILMGIGDRGQKFNGIPRSFPTVPNMIDAQRRAAKTAGVLFWDTREAMGGEDAIVRWREERLANGDYIHLNFKGGERLADSLFQSINRALNE